MVPELPTSIDESFSNLGGANAARRGILAVCDYLSHSPSKDWTAEQILDYHAHGVGVVFLWETTANRALSGYAGGFADGSDAAGHLATLIAQVSYAPTRPVAIIAAYDFDTTPAQYPVLDEYNRGFKAGLAGRALDGAYGEADLLDHFGSAIDVGFQTYAWSRGKVSTRAALYQFLNGQTIDGATVDFDRIIDVAGVGAWWAPGHEPSGTGTPITNTNEDDDMPQELIQLNPGPDVPAGVQDGVYLRTPGTAQFQHLNGDQDNYYSRRPSPPAPAPLPKRVVGYTEFFILQTEAADVAAAIAAAVHVQSTPGGPITFPAYSATVTLTPEA